MIARRRHRLGERGASVLYAVVLSPILLLSLALAADVGALQLQKQRLRSAVDQAAVVAVGGTAQAQSDAGLDPLLAAVRVRTLLADNLRPLQSDIAGQSADDVARQADVAVVNDVPAVDPFDSATLLRRPTIEVRVRLPVRTGLLQLAGVSPTVVLTVVAGADLRVSGAGGA